MKVSEDIYKYTHNPAFYKATNAILDLVVDKLMEVDDIYLIRDIVEIKIKHLKIAEYEEYERNLNASTSSTKE